MLRKLGFKCNSCNDILVSDGLCHCGTIGLIKKDKIHHLYLDDENLVEYVETYYDDNNRLIRVLDTLYKTLGKDIMLPERKENV